MARLSNAQRAERDFWLGCAEREDARAARDVETWSSGLCCDTWDAPSAGVVAGKDLYVRLQLFKPEHPMMYWWPTSNKVEDERGTAQGRVLAACFLAAMAEVGE